MAEHTPGLLLVFVEVADEDVDELNRWYDQEHGPEKLATPGYTGLRRFRSVDWAGGTSRFLAVYELTDPEVAAAPVAASAESSARMAQIMSRWKRWERSIWVEIEPGPATL